MELLHNWRDVFWKAWSVRFIAVAALLTGLEVLLPLLDVDLIPPGLFAGLSFVVAIGAFIARFVAQRDLSGRC